MGVAGQQPGERHGCPYCANQKVLADFNDLASKRPDIALEWHPVRNGVLTADAIAVSSRRKVWFQCREGHGWQSTVGNQTVLGQGCPVCAGQKVLPGLNDMATTSPDLAAQWHPAKNAPLTPRDVFRSTAYHDGLCCTASAARNEASLRQGGWAKFLRAFLAAECDRRLASRPGRSSSLRCGRSTWTRDFAAGGDWAAIEERPGVQPAGSGPAVMAVGW